MSITIKIEGLDELRTALNAMDFDGAVNQAIAETALEMESRVVRAIHRSPASGRVYEKYNPRRTHRASAPGQPPKSDTGALAGSVYSDIAPGMATVGSRLAYASYLEYGTQNMAPRPIWVPEAERARDALRDRITENLRDILR